VKEYIAAMTVRFGKKPIALRTDNGKEYVSSELSDFFRKEGIQHQLIISYSATKRSCGAKEQVID